MTEIQVKIQPQPLLLGELIQSNDTAQIEAVFEQLAAGRNGPHDFQPQ